MAKFLKFQTIPEILYILHKVATLSFLKLCLCDYSYAYMFLKGKVTIVRLASHEQEKDAAAQGATVAFINKYKDL